MSNCTNLILMSENWGMSLNKDNAIESFILKVMKGRPSKDNRNFHYYTIYTFQCQHANCTNTFKVRHNHLKRSKGLCNFHNRKLSDEFVWLYKRLQRSADDRRCELGISFKDFLEFTQEKNCFYCNRSIVWNPYWFKGVRHSTNLDRIDSDKGYIKGNIVVCCPDCNYSKQETSYEEFKKWVIDIYQNLLEKGELSRYL